MLHCTPCSSQRPTSGRCKLRHIRSSWRHKHVFERHAFGGTSDESQSNQSYLSAQMISIPRDSACRIKQDFVAKTKVLPPIQQMYRDNPASNGTLSHQARFVAKPSHYVANLRQSFLIPNQFLVTVRDQSNKLCVISSWISSRDYRNQRHAMVTGRSCSHLVQCRLSSYLELARLTQKPTLVQ